jgi:hypothetical protein
MNYVSILIGILYSVASTDIPRDCVQGTSTLTPAQVADISTDSVEYQLPCRHLSELDLYLVVLSFNNYSSNTPN